MLGSSIDLEAAQAMLKHLPAAQLKDMGVRLNVLQNMIVEELKWREAKDERAILPA